MDDGGGIAWSRACEACHLDRNPKLPLQKKLNLIWKPFHKNSRLLKREYTLLLLYITEFLFFNLIHVSLERGERKGGASYELAWRLKGSLVCLCYLCPKSTHSSLPPSLPSFFSDRVSLRSWTHVLFILPFPVFSFIGLILRPGLGVDLQETLALGRLRTPALKKPRQDMQRPRFKEGWQFGKRPHLVTWLQRNQVSEYSRTDKRDRGKKRTTAWAAVAHSPSCHCSFWCPGTFWLRDTAEDEICWTWAFAPQ